MRVVAQIGVVFVAMVTLGIGTTAVAQVEESELGLRLDWPAEGVVRTDVEGVDVLQLATAEETVDVALDVLLRSDLEPCASDPAACDRTENFVAEDPLTLEPIYGCKDGVDNDDDGFADIADPDCVGVGGWSFSVATAPCFELVAATVAGTAGDLQVNPPGRRDPEGSFQKTSLVDPEVNNGQNGAITAVVLSFQNGVILDQVSESSVLRLHGRLSRGPDVAPDMDTAPCSVRVLDVDEIGLIGDGQPVRTVVTVLGESRRPNIRDAAVQLVASGPSPGSPFVRGDCNADGNRNLTDGVFMLNYLFLQGPVPTCLAACDANGDGDLNITAAVFLLNYLFLAGPTPPEPSNDCGGAVEGDLSCDAFGACA